MLFVGENLNIFFNFFFFTELVYKYFWNFSKKFALKRGGSAQKFIFSHNCGKIIEEPMILLSQASMIEGKLVKLFMIPLNKAQWDLMISEGTT